MFQVKKSDIYSALYENKRKTYFHRTTQAIPTEQLLIDQNCTFKPVINESCPFVSERTLRNFANQQRRRKPPAPPASSEHSGSNTKKKFPTTSRFAGTILDMPISGMYTKMNGFVRGPPSQCDIPIFYFDPIAPPAFESGQYFALTEAQAALHNASSAKEEEDVYEEVLVTDDEDGGDETGGGNSKNKGLQAPPLPSWAFAAGGAPGGKGQSAAKTPFVLTINKKPKKETEAPAATGWNAVMVEMARKKEEIMNGKGVLRKIDVAKEKEAAAERDRAAKEAAKKGKKGKKKKGKDFKDVMDELAHRLAKLRGEVQESEGESDGEGDGEDEGGGGNSGTGTPSKKPPAPAAPPVAAPVTPAAKTPAAGGEEEESPATVAPIRKLPSKANMMNLLAKAIRPPQPPGALSAAAAEAEAAPATPAAARVVGKRAVAEAVSIPAPPPLPVDWPPTASLAVEPSRPAAADLVTPSKPKPKKTVKRKVQKAAGTGTGAGAGTPGASAAAFKEAARDLPQGYYMPAPVPGMVLPRQVTAGGTTSLELCASLQLTFDKAAAQLRDGDAGDAGGSPSLQQVRHLNIDLSLTLPEYNDRDDGDGYGVSGRDSGASPDHQQQQRIKDRLAIGDLPLPPDFHVAVQRMLNCNAKREALLEQQRDLELRSFLYYEKPDKQVDVVAAGGLGADAGGGGVAAGGAAYKRPEPTVPVDYFSHVDHHNENKVYSHRKAASVAVAASSAREREGDRPLHERIACPPATVCTSSTAKHDSVTAFWLSNLRPSVNSPTPTKPKLPGSTRTTPLQQPNSFKSPVASAHGGGGGGGSSAKGTPLNRYNQQQFYQSQQPSTPSQSVGPPITATALGSLAQAQSFLSPIDRRTQDAASELSSLDQQAQFSSGARYYMHYRPHTEAKAPKFHSEEALSRRHSERKLREEQRLQQEKEEEDRRKLKKEQMKQKALQAAQQVGAYKPSSRYHQHQKIFEKYNMHPDVGGNIEQSVKSAYAQYNATHHLPPSKGDQLYNASQNKAAQAQRQHQEELVRMRNLRQEFDDYDDDRHGFNFSSNQDNYLHY
jgi:hypothetical protein